MREGTQIEISPEPILEEAEMAKINPLKVKPKKTLIPYLSS